MTPLQKREIVTLLRKLINQPGNSANKVSTKFKISSSYISQFVNEKWEAIGDGMWAKLAAAVNYRKTPWVVVPTTSGFKDVTTYLEYAQHNAECFIYINQYGGSKTEPCKMFAAENGPCVSLVRCEDHWSKKDLVTKIAEGFGCTTSSHGVSSMIDLIEAAALSNPNPLIIFDEMDKLKDEQLYFFITLYNRLEDKCGFFCCGTKYLAERIDAGFKRGAKGFEELFSRGGGSYIYGPRVTVDDARTIIKANGIEESDVIEDIINRAYTTKDERGREVRTKYIDLRRVKRLTLAEQRKRRDKANHLQKELFEATA